MVAQALNRQATPPIGIDGQQQIINGRLYQTAARLIFVGAWLVLASRLSRVRMTVELPEGTVDTFTSVDRRLILSKGHSASVGYPLAGYSG